MVAAKASPAEELVEKKIVVHLKNGTVRKGVTHDFEPGGSAFHVLPAEGGGVPVKIVHEDMKALFYVKDYVGNRDFVARQQFDEARESGRKAIVSFKDGEQIWGHLGEGADDESPGFFFFPSDTRDNNVRIFVVRSAMEGLKLV